MELAIFTDGQWYVDMGILATVLVSVGIVWRMALRPLFKAIWAAIGAAPQIPIILDDVRDILRSDVLGKLEHIQDHMKTHESEAQVRDRRLDHHSVRLEDHEIRMGKVERDLADLMSEDNNKV